MTYCQPKHVAKLNNNNNNNNNNGNNILVLDPYFVLDPFLIFMLALFYIYVHFIMTTATG
jgi:hypothetical protein